MNPRRAAAERYKAMEPKASRRNRAVLHGHLTPRGWASMAGADEFSPKERKRRRKRNKRARASRKVNRT